MNLTPQFCGVLLYGLQNNYRPIRDQAYWSKSEGSLQWHKTANYKNALYKTKKRPTHCKPLSWCHQESNRGHKDFQSFALPTELWHQSFATAKVEIIFLSAKSLDEKYILRIFLYLLCRVQQQMQN